MIRTSHIRKMLDWAYVLTNSTEGADTLDPIAVEPPYVKQGRTYVAADILEQAAKLCDHAAAELRAEAAAARGWEQP